MISQIFSSPLKRSTRKAFITAASLLYLAVGLAIDLQTERELVIAIAYTVPIALSSFALSRRLTLTLLVFALAATLGAGVENALREGLDTVALLNRALAALSCVLVGMFVLMLNRSLKRVSFLEHEEVRAHHETELRQLMTALSRAEGSHELLEAAARGLQQLFGALRVVIAGTEGGRLSAPHHSYPSPGGDLCKGRLLPWVVASLPQTEPRVAAARVEGKLITVGRLPRPEGGDLIVLVARPTVEEPLVLLAEALEGLEPLLAHAVRLESAEHQRRAQSVRVGVYSR